MSEQKLRPRVTLARLVHKFKAEYQARLREDVKKLFNEFRTLPDIYNYLFVVFFDELWE